MAKKIRFPLKMKSNDVRTIEELRENFDIESILGYYANGKLLIWLKDRYYDNEFNAVEALESSDNALAQKLCDIFGVEYTAVNNEPDMESIRIRNDKLTKLRQLTENQKIIDAVDLVAFNQDELFDILDEEMDKIYLCGEQFSIPFGRKNIKYIGVNNPLILLGEHELQKFQEQNIFFENVHFIAPIQEQVDEERKLQEAKIKFDAKKFENWLVSHSNISVALQNVKRMYTVWNDKIFYIIKTESDYGYIVCFESNLDRTETCELCTVVYGVFKENLQELGTPIISHTKDYVYISTLKYSSFQSLYIIKKVQNKYKINNINEQNGFKIMAKNNNFLYIFRGYCKVECDGWHGWELMDKLQIVEIDLDRNSSDTDMDEWINILSKHKVIGCVVDENMLYYISIDFIKNTGNIGGLQNHTAKVYFGKFNIKTRELSELMCFDSVDCIQHGCLSVSNITHNYIGRCYPEIKGNFLTFSIDYPIATDSNGNKKIVKKEYRIKISETNSQSGLIDDINRNKSQSTFRSVPEVKPQSSLTNNANNDQPQSTFIGKLKKLFNL